MSNLVNLVSPQGGDKIILYDDLVIEFSPDNTTVYITRKHHTPSEVSPMLMVVLDGDSSRCWHYSNKARVDLSTGGDRFDFNVEPLSKYKVSLL